MTDTKNLFALQRTDDLLTSIQIALNSVLTKLADTKEIAASEEELRSAEERLKELTNRSRESELEITELQKSIEKIRVKLFGGKITNSKELVSLEQESDMLKRNVKDKEDDLLVIMEEEEKTRSDVEIKASQFERLKSEKQQVQHILLNEQKDLETKLLDFKMQRETVVAAIPAAIVSLYDGIRKRKSTAVALVEQGRCKGCRINLSISEIQKVKGGSIVQCSSCGIILFSG